MPKRIAELVGFDLERFSIVQALEEANKKFVSTWVLINGTPCRILGFDKTTFTFENNKNKDGKVLKYSDIISISAVMPETGLYSTSQGLYYIGRLPRRQWLKSYALGRNYVAHPLLDCTSVNPSVDLILSKENHKFNKTALFHNNILFLKWKKIGHYDKNGTTVLSTLKYLNEIKQIWPQFRVILDQNSHLKFMEERKQVVQPLE
jgi:hypothetical protein